MARPEYFLKVHSIESFGTHDGPGIRLVIFLQGCNIECMYCQNADTITLSGGTMTEITELVRRAVNMKTYFGADGGVTVSGGEPMLHSKALVPFFKALKAEGIHTNIDTNGTICTPSSEELIGQISDLVMFDVKATNDDDFYRMVGSRGLKKVLANIALREKNGKPYWLRYVLVPGYTDSDEQLQWLIDTFKNNQHLEKLEILPYHKLGEYKWEGMGKEYRLKDVAEHTPEQLEAVYQKLESHFKEVKLK